jgi:3-methyladenine DNA glycosylase/8-oxoguanine DNA glycosylase
VLVRLPQPYDLALSFERYRTFGPDLAWRWHDGGLHRVVGGIEVRVEQDDGGVRVAPADPSLEAPLLHLLGGAFDLAGFRRAAATEPVLGPLVERLAGFRPPLAPDPFEQLVGAITAQQISLHASRAIRNRLIERFSAPAGLAWPFPPAARLAEATERELTALGFSRRKAQCVLALARAGPDYDAIAALPDEEAVAALCELPGVGRWTAEWFLARHLGRPDVWPAGDLGLRKAVAALVLGRSDATEAETRAAGERFRPHRNLAAHYLLTGMRVSR